MLFIHRFECFCNKILGTLTLLAVNLHKDHWSMNYSAKFFVVKFKFIFMIFFEFFTRGTMHSTSSTINSYGDYLFAISTGIYRELSDDP